MPSRCRCWRPIFTSSSHQHQQHHYSSATSKALRSPAFNVVLGKVRGSSSRHHHKGKEPSFRLPARHAAGRQARRARAPQTTRSFTPRQLHPPLQLQICQATGAEATIPPAMILLGSKVAMAILGKVTPMLQPLNHNQCGKRRL